MFAREQRGRGVGFLKTYHLNPSQLSLPHVKGHHVFLLLYLSLCKKTSDFLWIDFLVSFRVRESLRGVFAAVEAKSVFDLKLYDRLLTSFKAVEQPACHHISLIPFFPLF